MASIFLNLKQAVSELAAGKVVAIPTETVYGLAASINKEEALHSIFTLKKRPFFDPLIIHVSNISQAQTLVNKWTKIAEHLANTFWPGPLTIVCEKSKIVSDLITAGHTTVAIRCPEHPFARRIIRQLGIPLAAPSANMFGKTSPTQASHVKDEFPSANFLIIDGGPSQHGIESTVVGVEEDDVIIYRPGIIGKNEIEIALKKIDFSGEIKSQSKNLSPGHTEQHYQPTTPLVIVGEKDLPLTKESLSQLHKHLKLKGEQHIRLNLPNDPTTTARLLYAELRRGDKLKPDFMLAVKRKEMQGDTWDAIWDRLNRASSYKLS